MTDVCNFADDANLKFLVEKWNMIKMHPRDGLKINRNNK